MTLRVMSVNSIFLCPTLGWRPWFAAQESSLGLTDKEDTDRKAETVRMQIQLQLSGATLTTPHLSLPTQGTTSRFLWLPLAAFHFPHDWKLDTVICYWVCGLLRPSLYGKLKAGLYSVVDHWSHTWGSPYVKLILYRSAFWACPDWNMEFVLF